MPSIQTIYPDNLDKQMSFQLKQKVFLGLSLASSNFAKEEFLRLIKLAKNFSQYSILLDDSLYAFTLQIQNGLDAENAMQLAKAIAEEVKLHQLQLLETFNNYETSFTLHSDLAKTQLYRDIFIELEDLSQTDKRFSTAIEAASKYYLESQLAKKEPTEEIIAIAKEYLITELTGFAVMSCKGNKAMLYLGPIAIIEKILSLKIPFIEEVFSNFHFVAVDCPALKSS
jgi:tRNA-dependent cyclodipeptide synthase